MNDAQALGWGAKDLTRLREIAPAGFEEPEDIRHVIDWFGYLAEWRTHYQIRSARSSLHGRRITCIDSAILSYGLLELLFCDVKRRLLAIHRRDPAGEECGHCVTLYWNERGQIGAFSKSSFEGLGHRDAVFADEPAIASSYAEAYIKMGFEPLYFGITALEEIAPDLDWRFDVGALNVISDRLKERYEYAFMLAR
ncbi:MAG: hypothetical protein JWN44_914 [Myxococcales bacterium]|nr:hypothetical protein [Myxococcales bacterium]